MKDVIVMIGIRMIISFQLQKQIPQQLHSNCMGMENRRLPAYEIVGATNIFDK